MSQQKHQKISLGFTHQDFEPGVHICQIFSEDDERHEALSNFILSGLKAKEKTCCFSENENDKSLTDFLNAFDLSFEELEKSGALTLSGTNKAYFKDDKFDPERMLGLVKDFYLDAEKEDYTASRIIGEMTPYVQNVEGGSRLLEYESKISLLLKEFPVTAVCQYDARQFDGGTILDVLKVHPYMIIKGEVVQNPFFIPPEEFLEKIGVKYKDD